MDKDLSLRQRLQLTVLEASIPAGKTHNAVIFGAILLSVLAPPAGTRPPRQLSPAPNQCALDRSGSKSLLGGVCGEFRSSLALVEKPRRYLFSFTGLIDASAVLFFFVPQVRRELLLWVFKFGRILRMFKLLNSSMKPACWGRHRRDALHCDACGASLPLRA